MDEFGKGRFGDEKLVEIGANDASYFSQRPFVAPLFLQTKATINPDHDGYAARLAKVSTSPDLQTIPGKPPAGFERQDFLELKPMLSGAPRDRCRCSWRSTFPGSGCPGGAATAATERRPDKTGEPSGRRSEVVRIYPIDRMASGIGVKVKI